MPERGELVCPGGHPQDVTRAYLEAHNYILYWCKVCCQYYGVQGVVAA